MSNVIQFPTNKSSPIKKDEQKLINLAKMLDARYEHLKELVDTIEVVEKECEKFEKQYETILKDYAARIGPENVEIKFYDYSAEVNIEFDPDMGTFFIDKVDRTGDHSNELH